MVDIIRGVGGVEYVYTKRPRIEEINPYPYKTTMVNVGQGFFMVLSLTRFILRPGFYDIMKVIANGFSEVVRMRWEEVREQFPNEWVVCEALKSRSEEGYWLIDEVAIIDRFEDSSIAMKRYYELHREQPYREYGFFHTSRETLKLREKWAGVRGPR